MKIQIKDYNYQTNGGKKIKMVLNARVKKCMYFCLTIILVPFIFNFSQIIKSIKSILFPE